MSARSPLGVRFTRSWVSFYTGGLSEEAGKRRRMEIESDVYEHLQVMGIRGVLGRGLRGIPADVWWRIRTLRERAGEAERNPNMANNPHRILWVALVIAHLAISVAIGVPWSAGNRAGASSWAISLVIAGIIGAVIMVVGLFVQRRQLVTGSWVVLIGLVPTLLSLTGGLVLIYGLWTANLVFLERTAQLGHEAISTKRSDSLSERWWVWLVASGVLFGIAFLGLLANITLVWLVASPPAAFAALVGIAGLARQTTKGQRASTRMEAFKEGWWRFTAGAFAATYAFFGIEDLFTRDGPLYKRPTGDILFLLAAGSIVAGLVLRKGNRRLGSIMIAIGSLPGAAAIALFWFPPFLVFGLLSIAVVATAFTDATKSDRPALASG